MQPINNLNLDGLDGNFVGRILKNQMKNGPGLFAIRDGAGRHPSGYALEFSLNFTRRQV